MGDWYPSRESELVQWHATFSASLSSYAAALGIPAGTVTQVSVDSGNVAVCLNAVEIAENYRSEVVAFKDQMLGGLLNTPTPPVPTVPTAIVLVVGSLGNIEARTRQLVAQIKANSAFTPQMGQDMGIFAPGAAVVEPSVVSATAEPGSIVDVRVTFGSASAAVLFRQVGAGGWSLVTIMTKATYADDAPPGTPGQPETRSYRVQAYVDNAPTGPYSDIVSVVTIP